MGWEGGRVCLAQKGKRPYHKVKEQGGQEPYYDYKTHLKFIKILILL